MFIWQGRRLQAIEYHCIILIEFIREVNEANADQVFQNQYLFVDGSSADFCRTS